MAKLLNMFVSNRQLTVYDTGTYYCTVGAFTVFSVNVADKTYYYHCLDEVVFYISIIPNTKLLRYINKRKIPPNTLLKAEYIQVISNMEQFYSSFVYGKDSIVRKIVINRFFGT